MDDRRVGAAFRGLRIRRGWSQDELADKAATSRWTIARVERGQLGTVRVATLRRIAEGLDARLDLMLRWQGGELERLLNARHGLFHEIVAQRFARLSGWVAVPEVTFSIYGERGVFDILAWHAASLTVLVIELKTEIVDVQELIGTLDRKRRLARKVAEERGWTVRHVAAWLAVAEGRTNRRRVEGHRTVLAGAFPDPAVRVGRWLVDPSGPSLAAVSFVSDVHGSRARSGLATPKRVRRRGPCTSVADAGARRAAVAQVAAADVDGRP